MKSEEMKKNKQKGWNSRHCTAVSRMAAGQTEGMGPCSEKQKDNLILYKDNEENIIQQNQPVCIQQSQEKAPDEQSDKQSPGAEQSQSLETSIEYFHEHSGAAKQSGKYQASEKETQCQGQTAPVDYFLGQSGTGEQPSGTDKLLLERCWYCMKLLPLEELNISQGNESSQSFVGTELSFQQDPRPHFGVAHSSRSTAHPLWSSDGPREMQRDPDEKNKDSISSCPYCYLRLPLNTLLWHKEKCMSFGSPRKDV